MGVRHQGAARKVTSNASVVDINLYDMRELKCPLTIIQLHKGNLKRRKHKGFEFVQSNFETNKNKKLRCLIKSISLFIVTVACFIVLLNMTHPRRQPKRPPDSNDHSNDNNDHHYNRDTAEV